MRHQAALGDGLEHETRCRGRHTLSERKWLHTFSLRRGSRDVPTRRVRTDDAPGCLRTCAAPVATVCGDAEQPGFALTVIHTKLAGCPGRGARPASTVDALHLRTAQRCVL